MLFSFNLHLSFKNKDVKSCPWQNKKTLKRREMKSRLLLYFQNKVSTYGLNEILSLQILFLFLVRWCENSKCPTCAPKSLLGSGLSSVAY